ncbi:asparagine--tRNA ligase [Candidatus Shikimatogenerans bostrichidophilus]|uniref:asparagine--tRNA ligase n=1 Tax=Candidatus Shikimatogenerans bostrichidophilus TaxID=2943807 RepID=UPI0029667F07
MTIKYIINNKKKLINKKFWIKGWVKYLRNNLFLDINDGSTINNIQIVFKKKIKNINIGITLKVFGKLILLNNKVEIIPLYIKKYGNINKNYFNNSILQNKFHNLHTLRKQKYLRFRTKIFSTIMRIRHNLSIFTHNYFHKKNFYYIHTPIITYNDTEGVGNMFKVTTLDIHNKYYNYKKDFFGDKANLTVSGQLEAESAMIGLCKVYTFGPVFRAENSNTNKHLSEFWMIEPEIMFYNLKKIIKLSENFIKYLIKKILKNCKDELLFLENYNNKKIIKNLYNIYKNKFIIISYNKIIKILNKINKKNKISWGEDINSKNEKILFKKKFKKKIPLIIYNWPKTIKPFYMKINKDNITTKSFDILFPYIGEIIGGSEREDSYKKLLKSIKEKKIKRNKINWYLNLRKLGNILHSGFGVGFDRLVQLITGMKNIRDVIPYPRYPGNNKNDK